MRVGGLRSRRDAGGHLGRPDRRGERRAGRGRASGRRSTPGATGRSPSPAGGRCCAPGSRGPGAATRRRSTRLYPRLLELYARGARRCTPGSTTGRRRRSTGWRPTAGGSRSAPTSPSGWRALLLEALGLGGRFAALLGADSLPWRKPDPRHLLETIARAGGVPERAVLVGDTVTDRDAARAAGVPCVLVGFGPEGGAVAALAPEALLARISTSCRRLLGRLVPARAIPACGPRGTAGYKARRAGVAQW